MPAYSYECEKCGRTETVVAAMDEDRKVPRCCRAEMLRDYRGIQFVSDELKEPEHMTTMLPVWGNGPKYPENHARAGRPMYDIVRSESERVKWTNDYNDMLNRTEQDGRVTPTIPLKRFKGKRVTKRAAV